VHPDDLCRLTNTLTHAFQVKEAFSNEFRLRHWKGHYRWMLNTASPRKGADGSFVGFIGSAVDLTDQKLAQEALERVSGQLIQAQENERSRIARELHDDICQRLALLSMELDVANGRVVDGSVVPLDLEEIQRHCIEIAKDTQSLSHQLHSSTLELLGLVPALHSLSGELSKQHKLEITLRVRNMPARLPHDISLCLFRVAQEALHNAIKYSGDSQNVAVELFGQGDEISLAIIDKGKGFEVEGAKSGRGLGLISMQERVHLLRGTLAIKSRPGEGTRVYAAIPFHHSIEDVVSDIEEKFSSESPRESYRRVNVPVRAHTRVDKALHK
jgi:signal transduction histidine kinase